MRNITQRRQELKENKMTELEFEIAEAILSMDWLHIDQQLLNACLNPGMAIFLGCLDTIAKIEEYELGEWFECRTFLVEYITGISPMNQHKYILYLIEKGYIEKKLEGCPPTRRFRRVMGFYGGLNAE